MNHAISIELKFFFISILWGAIILFAYDLLRILRRIIKHNNIGLAIEDIVFWILVSVFIFSMIYRENNGIIRGFSIMGVTIGMVLYHYLISDIFVNLITKLIQILLTPFHMAVNWVKKLLHFVYLKGKTMAKFIIRRLKNQYKSYRMKVNKRRQALEAKRKKRLDQKTEERKKKEELLAAKRRVKAKQREKEGKNKNTAAKKKNQKKRARKSAHETSKNTEPDKGSAKIKMKHTLLEPINQKSDRTSAIGIKGNKGQILDKYNH